MKADSLLEWINVIGTLVISWPVVGLIALTIFRKPITGIITQFSGSEFVNKAGTMKVKVGLVELEKNIISLKEKVEDQKNEQENQKSEIQTLRFLVSNFVTDAELTHLKKLARTGPFEYNMAPYFELELRRLRSLGLIENFPDKGIRSMTPSGNLKDYFTITDRGREYLNLRTTNN